MRFRPCIDLKNGKVVQIVGGSLSDGEAALKTNFESERSPGEFAAQYQENDLSGGHVIALGPGNREAALEALRAFHGGMHYAVKPEPSISLKARFFAGLLTLLKTALSLTYRVDSFEGQERWERIVTENTPVLLTAWHNRIFYISLMIKRAIVRREFKLAIMTSLSKDGQIGAAMGMTSGARVVRVLPAWHKALPQQAAAIACPAIQIAYDHSDAQCSARHCQWRCAYQFGLTGSMAAHRVHFAPN